jgi:hypothetical protein
LNHKFTSKLRQLAKDYGTLAMYLNIYHRVVLTPPTDEALIAFNQVMMMEVNFQLCLLSLPEFLCFHLLNLNDVLKGRSKQHQVTKVNFQCLQSTLTINQEGDSDVQGSLRHLEGQSSNIPSHRCTFGEGVFAMSSFSQGDWKLNCMTPFFLSRLRLLTHIQLE